MCSTPLALALAALKQYGFVQMCCVQCNRNVRPMAYSDERLCTPAAADALRVQCTTQSVLCTRTTRLTSMCIVCVAVAAAAADWRAANEGSESAPPLASSTGTCSLLLHLLHCTVFWAHVSLAFTHSRIYAYAFGCGCRAAVKQCASATSHSERMHIAMARAQREREREHKYCKSKMR